MEMILDDLMHGEAIRISIIDPTHEMLPKPICPVYYLSPRPPTDVWVYDTLTAP